MQKKVISRETCTAIPVWPFVSNSYEISYSLLSKQGKHLKENLQVKKKIKKFGLTPCSTAFEGTAFEGTNTLYGIITPHANYNLLSGL